MTDRELEAIEKRHEANKMGAGKVLAADGMLWPGVDQSLTDIDALLAEVRRLKKRIWEMT